MSAFSASDLPSLAGKPLPTIQVNKHNLAELKQACDDAVRSVSPLSPFVPQYPWPFVLTFAVASFLVAGPQ